MTSQTISPAGRPLGVGAALIMVMLCVSWGFNQIAVKLALPDIPPLTQAATRSFGALLIILAGAALRGIPVFRRDGTLWPGLFAGVLFGAEFILVFQGLLYTSASRGVVFLYTAPFVVALGSRFLLGERLSSVQWSGLALSFLGIAVAIGVPQPGVDARMLLGDAMLLLAGALWAATTLVVKATRLLQAPAEKTLGYQLAVSVPILAIGALLAGEQIAPMPRSIALYSLAYQTIWVVGITFLLWFMLVKTYSASKLSSFTFMTPLFGVVAGYLVLNDPITPAFLVAALLVIAGLVLVNRPPPAVRTPA